MSTMTKEAADDGTHIWAGPPGEEQIAQVKAFLMTWGPTGINPETYVIDVFPHHLAVTFTLLNGHERTEEVTLDDVGDFWRFVA